MYLLTKNLRTKRLSKGLNNVKVGLFLIAAKIGLVNYKLKLLDNARIYPMFYILMLELVDLETLLQITFRYLPKEETKFKVEKLLDYYKIG